MTPHSRSLGRPLTSVASWTTAKRPVAPLVRDEEAAIRGNGGTACDPRAIARGRPRSRTGSHGHSTVAGTKAPDRHLR